MIQSFGDKETNKLFEGLNSKIPPDIRKRALIKLAVLNAAPSLEFLTIPPSNHLEALKGDLAGFYSIRVNKQWRIVFRFKGTDAFDVSIMDYH